MGPGKTTYMFSVTFRSGRLACYQQAGVGGSGGEGVGQVVETESTLALEENVYVNLPRPMFYRVVMNVVES